MEKGYRGGYRCGYLLKPELLSDQQGYKRGYKHEYPPKPELYLTAKYDDRTKSKP